MKVGVVDIGTNSMRLLIMDGFEEVGRWVEVTGLGRGVDETGRLGDTEMGRTLEALRMFGDEMERADVSHRAAMATSATRDASNRDSFMAAATAALGVAPEVITGDREGRLAYAGGTSGLDQNGDYLVADIGGGSTELVSSTASVSVDIGSVRLTDRVLASRPASPDEIERARIEVQSVFGSVELPEGDRFVGVAGTWTTLAAIHLGLDRYDRSMVHHHEMTHAAVSELMWWLSGKTIAQTADIPAMDPRRAPVILAGAVIADFLMSLTGAPTVTVSEFDTLDGRAAELIGLP